METVKSYSLQQNVCSKYVTLLKPLNSNEFLIDIRTKVEIDGQLQFTKTGIRLKVSEFKKLCEILCDICSTDIKTFGDENRLIVIQPSDRANYKKILLEKKFEGLKKQSAIDVSDLEIVKIINFSEQIIEFVKHIEKKSNNFVNNYIKKFFK